MILSVLPYAAFSTAVVGMALNARQNKFCWYFSFSSAVAWIIHTWYIREWMLSLNQAVYAMLYIYGWRKWSKMARAEQMGRMR